MLSVTPISDKVNFDSLLFANNNFVGRFTEMIQIPCYFSNFLPLGLASRQCLVSLRDVKRKAAQAFLRKQFLELVLLL